MHRSSSCPFSLPPPAPLPATAAPLHLLAPIHLQHLLPPPPIPLPPSLPLSNLYGCHSLHWLSGDGQVHFRQRGSSSSPPSIHRRLPSFLSISPAPLRHPLRTCLTPTTFHQPPHHHPKTVAGAKTLTQAPSIRGGPR